MAHSFHLKLISDGNSPHHYRALVDGTLEAFLLLEEDSDTIYLSDRDGALSDSMRMSLLSGKIEVIDKESSNPTSLGVEDFRLLAAHLGSQWKKQGKAPSDIRKFFA
ncbi:hypothetical protein ACFZA9_19125 [Streptomyces olivaceus]|uniref:hypothetical protein n=1 Tax=Streptomyces olivaceus TaxID=47716 RepID=UPI0036EE2D9D